MRTRVLLQVALLITLASGQGVRAAGQQFRSNGYGPEIKSYLDFLRGEEEELNFQIRRQEITRKAYQRAKSKVAILRQAVLRIYDETGVDNVPELHVVASDELDQLIEDGAALLKDLKPGAVIGEKWRYVGPVTRGEPFHVFERLTRM
jgi:hypothetical protein